MAGRKKPPSAAAVCQKELLNLLVNYIEKRVQHLWISKIGRDTLFDTFDHLHQKAVKYFKTRKAANHLNKTNFVAPFQGLLQFLLCTKAVYNKYTVGITNDENKPMNDYLNEDDINLFNKLNAVIIQANNKNKKVSIQLFTVEFFLKSIAINDLTDQVSNDGPKNGYWHFLTKVTLNNALFHFQVIFKC